LRYGGYQQQRKETADVSLQIIFSVIGGIFANKPSLIGIGKG